MSAVRLGVWVAGMVVAAASAAAVPESLFPGVRPSVFGAVFLSVALVGEHVLSVVSARSAPARRARDTRPADGRVDLARMAGVRRAPNEVDARFGRFVAREPAGGAGLIVKSEDRTDERTSPPLLGRVVLVSLFVGRDARPWSDVEIAEAHVSLRRAGAWVEQEARRYGAAVNLELADTYFVFDDEEADEVLVGFSREGDEVGPMEEGAVTKALVGASRAAARLGFRDAVDLFRSVEAGLESDATVWVIQPRRAGRSFAVPREDSSLRGVSLAVCYPRESSFPEPLSGPARADPVTIVHELLHLFGAADKYGVPLRRFAPRTVTAKDVMRLKESRLSRLRIDPGTAAEVGWPLTVPETTAAGASPEGSRRPPVID